MAESRVYTVTDKVKFIEGVFGAGNMARNGRNFAIWCPICAPKDRHKRKLVIRLEDDANHCWTCTWRARSLGPLLRKYASQRDLITYRDTFMRPEVRNLWIDPSEQEEKREIMLPDDFQLLALSDPRDPDTRSILRYIGSRNITDRDVWYYKLGRSDDPKWSRRVMMPSFDAEGNLNYLVGRAVDRQKKRYENEEADRTSIVFNEININWSKRLVLCEGPFDLVKCGDNATCLLGCTLHEQHLLFDRIVTHGTPVAIALDEEARDNALAIARKLREYDIDVVMVDLMGHKDPGEMSKQAFKNALEAATSYSWMSDFRHRIRKASEVSLSS